MPRKSKKAEFKLHWFNHCVITLAITLGIFAVAWTASSIIIMAPTIAKSLSMRVDSMQWLVVSFLLVLAVGTTFFSRLAEYVGHYKMLVFGYLWFLAGSLIMALSHMGWLALMGMSFLGIGAAVTVACSMRAFRLTINKEHCHVAGLFWILTFAVGFAIGPIVGGAFATFVTWRLLFWINVPIIGAAILFLIFYPLFGIEPASDRQLGVDIIGTILWGVMLTMLMLIMTEGHYWGWTSATFITFYAVTPTLFLFFLLWSGLYKKALVNFSFLGNRSFFVGSVMLFAACFALYGLLYLYSIYLQLPLGSTNQAFHVGLTLLPLNGAILLFTIFFLLPMPHACMTWVLRLGSLILFGSLLSFFWVYGDTSYANLWWRLLLVGIGLGMVLPKTVRYVLKTVDQEAMSEARENIYHWHWLGAVFGVVFANLWAMQLYAGNATSLVSGYTYGMLLCFIVAAVAFLVVLFFARATQR